jgi:hypothetical protein
MNLNNIIDSFLFSFSLKLISFPWMWSIFIFQKQVNSLILKSLVKHIKSINTCQSIKYSFFYISENINISFVFNSKWLINFVALDCRNDL